MKYWHNNSSLQILNLFWIWGYFKQAVLKAQSSLCRVNTEAVTGSITSACKMTHFHQQPSENLPKEKQAAKVTEEGKPCCPQQALPNASKLSFNRTWRKKQLWRYSSDFPTFYFRGVTVFFTDGRRSLCSVQRIKAGSATLPDTAEWVILPWDISFSH